MTLIPSYCLTCFAQFRTRKIYLAENGEIITIDAGVYESCPACSNIAKVQEGTYKRVNGVIHPQNDVSPDAVSMINQLKLQTTPAIIYSFKNKQLLTGVKLGFLEAILPPCWRPAWTKVIVATVIIIFSIGVLLSLYALIEPIVNKPPVPLVHSVQPQ